MTHTIHWCPRDENDTQTLTHRSEQEYLDPIKSVINSPIPVQLASVLGFLLRQNLKLKMPSLTAGW